MMRITIVMGPFLPLPPAPTCGAVEIRWAGVARELVSQGHEVTVLCRAHPGQPAEEHLDGVRFVRQPAGSRSGKMALDLLRDWRYSLAMARRLPAADVLVTNSFWMPVVAASRRDHAGAIVVNVARYPKGQLRLYRAASRFVTGSNAIAEAIAEQRPAAAAITRVVPNPIDTSVFIPPAEPRSCAAEQRIVYTGRLHPEKGVHLLVAAFARLQADYPALRLRLVGPCDAAQGGQGSYRDELARLAAGLPVDFTGALSDRQELADELRASHLYCYPSLAEKGESFGVAPLEAMATGLAPVVSDLACFRDFMTDGVTGCVFDHRAADPVAALVAALRTMLADPGRTRRMGETAALTAQAFSYGNVARRYAEDFAELLAEKACGRGA